MASITRPHGFTAGIFGFLSSVIDLVYPTICVGCGIVISKSPIPVCVSCFAGLEEVEGGQTRRFLGSIAEMPSIDFACALWYYDEGSPVRMLHRSFKYDGFYSLGVGLGKLLGAHIERSLNGRQGPDVILPVPVHRVRLTERGYNQTEAMAAGVTEILNIPVETGALTRKRLSGSQTGLDRASRTMNLAGAFVLKNPDRIHGRRVLLLDDVITTGATIAEAVRTLGAAGPAACSIAALALVRPPGKLSGLRREPSPSKAGISQR